MKAGYLSCSLLGLVGAGCQQQLFLNCIDTYLLLTPHANIKFFSANMNLEIDSMGFQKP